MTSNLPVPTLPGLAKAIEKEAWATGTVAVVQAQELTRYVESAGSAAERADKHIQLWREGMAKLPLEIAFTDDPELDAAFARVQRTAAWKILQRAALESPRVMAELRAYWKPEDKVEIR